MEKIDESKLNLPATKNQKELIQQLIRDIPASKEMLEYAARLGYDSAEQWMALLDLVQNTR